MPLPDLIEIVPLAGPVRTEITVPGSKSITNRALVLAALADGETILRGALWSEDTQVMVECLRELGFMVNVDPDAEEFCNRTITVYGLGGHVPRGGTAEQPLELFVGNAGTAARFLSAMVCLGEGVYRLHGVPRMHERPQAALFGALRELGYRIDSTNDKLPALVYGSSDSPVAARGGPGRQESRPSDDRFPRSCTVSVAESSQFASALLLCAKVGGWQVKIVGENAEESPYVAMTSKLMEAFPKQGGPFHVEPDASSGSYFWAAGVSMGKRDNSFIRDEGQAAALMWTFMWSVKVLHWPSSGWQIDEQFPMELLNLVATSEGFGMPWELQARQEHGLNWHQELQGRQKGFEISRKDRLGDSMMTLIVIAPFNTCAMSFTDLGRLRVQECERVAALRTELTKCGAKVIETGDTLEVFPSELHGAEIETYQDHRMAMCFAILGLKVPGLRIKNPACVKKTFPNFFQKLAAPPPHGLGTEIRDAATGRVLNADELFAD